MIVNFSNINLNNHFLYKPKQYKNNCLSSISFGLNDNNKQAISRLHQNPEDKISIIKSIDMSDSDIEPCLIEFSHIVSEEPTNSEEMNVILEQLKAARNKTGIKDCLSSFTKYWQKFFLSTRTKASEIMDSMRMEHPPVGFLSRTATNPEYANIAVRNIQNAQGYITENVEFGICPDKNLLINIHKIITKDLPIITKDGTTYDGSQYSGIIKKTKTIQSTEEEDFEGKLDNFMNWLARNYDKDDTFQLMAQSYKKLLGICPFYDANGRTIRCFMDALLYSKGYHFREYPPNYAEVRSMHTEDLKKLFEDNCEEITSTN